MAYTLSRKQGAFLDVGANIGQTLLNVIPILGNSEYIGVEPSIPCCHYLERLVTLNGWSNCRIFPIGLGARTEFRDVFFVDEYDEGATMLSTFRPESRYTNRRKSFIIQGDSFLEMAGVDKLACIKVDVEGAEADVIEGLTKIFAKSKPAIIMEVLPFSHIYHDDKMNSCEKTKIVDSRYKNHERINSNLKISKYLIYRINKNGTLSTADGFDMEHYDEYKVNYAAFHDDDVSHVSELME